MIEPCSSFVTTTRFYFVLLSSLALLRIDCATPVAQTSPESDGSRTLTVGEARFKEAEALLRDGRTNQAMIAFQKLRREFRQSWIDRVSRERLVKLGAEGIADKYPGDAGIERDPRVLFAENFENGDLATLSRRWDQISNQDGKVVAFSDDVPPGSPGKRSLQMTATLGENTGGHLYTRLSRPVERVFARFYVKFPNGADAAYIHHFVTVGGYFPATPWPQGGAGERPRGDERFTIGIEPYGNYGRYAPPGAWNFYAYWLEMKGSADGRFWGNSLTPTEPALAPRDRWQCVEMMVQCNSAPDRADGELALWLDGEPVAHFYPGVRRTRWTGLGFSLAGEGGEPFEGFRWRTNDDLKVNFFWLLHYVTENAARQNRVAHPNPVNRVWFDHIVLGTAYVGPIRK